MTEAVEFTSPETGCVPTAQTVKIAPLVDRLREQYGDPDTGAFEYANPDGLEAAAEIDRLRAENKDLKAMPWPRAYVMERASEWDRLLRETHGYIHTCRGRCGSDTSGRDHALAALAEARKMLTPNFTPSTAGISDPSSEIDHENNLSPCKGDTL